MLFLFLLGIWGGPAGAAPTFNPAWAGQANKYLGPMDTQPT